MESLFLTRPINLVSPVLPRPAAPAPFTHRQFVLVVAWGVACSVEMISQQTVWNFISQINLFNDLYRFENSEKLCQIILTACSFEDEPEFKQAIHFLWAHSLFSLQRYKECIVVCDKIDYLRCKYLKAVCLERLDRLLECVEECNLLLGSYFVPNNPRAVGKGLNEILYPKYAMPNENVVHSMLASCHRRLGHQFDYSKHSKSAFKLNSFDIESFLSIVQNGFDKTISTAELCTTSPSGCVIPVETCPSPATQIALSVNKRLSLDGSNSPQKRPEPPRCSPKMTTRGSSTSTESCKKSFQRKLFETAEENLSNNQSIDEIYVPKNSAGFRNSQFFTYESFFSFYGWFIRKDYQECLKFVEQRIKYKGISSSPLECLLIANVYYENLNYEKAREYFELIMRDFPHFLHEILYYSSTLWHLKDLRGLEYLSKFLLESDKQSEITWIATGNMYSAKKLPDSAIRSFQKAISLNPSCSYAFILMGYEYLAGEDLSKSISAFLESYKLNADYKSLFGISLVAIKECQWDKAEKYLLKASTLSPKNSVLHYYLAIVYESMDRLQESCAAYSKSIEFDPSNITAKFKRARLLFKMHDLKHSLMESLSLVSQDSSEPAVFLLLARIYKEMGDLQNSIKYFTWGTSLLSEFNALKRELESNAA